MIEKIAFASGCFWCSEAAFSSLKGVISVTPGYTGGHLDQPTYADVCSGESGHAETVLVTYDSEKIPLAQLLDVFWTIHDPTTLNYQGADVGTQYRSAIFFSSTAQEVVLRRAIQELTQARVYAQPIVTQLEPLTQFFPAETEHRRYFEQHPEQAYCQVVIAPKLHTLFQKHTALLNLPSSGK